MSAVENIPHALFTSAPFFGHLKPLLLQADELVRRGWNVSVASFEEARPIVAGHHELVFKSLGPSGIDQATIDELRDRITVEPNFARGMLIILNTLGRGWTNQYDGLLEILRRERPNVLIADLSSTAAISAADAVGVTCVVNNPDLLTVLPAAMLPPTPGIPLLLSGKSVRSIGAIDRWLYPLRRAIATVVANIVVGRPLNSARRSRDLPGVDFHRWLRDRLVLVNSAFGLEYPRPLPPGAQMVGPMLPPEYEPLPAELDAWLAAGPPIVFVNLGTVARPWPELLQRMAKGFEAEDFRTLWVLRAEGQTMLPNLPRSIRVEEWVSSQIAVLQHPNVRAFVSHCGTNSVQESVWAGTPVVGIPLFAAQRDMALRLQDAGIGSWLNKHRFTPQQLREHVRHAFRSNEFRTKISALQSGFASAGGVARAADLIEHAAALR